MNVSLPFEVVLAFAWVVVLGPVGESPVDLVGGVLVAGEYRWPVYAEVWAVLAEPVGASGGGECGELQREPELTHAAFAGEDAASSSWDESVDVSLPGFRLAANVGGFDGCELVVGSLHGCLTCGKPVLCDVLRRCLRLRFEFGFVVWLEACSVVVGDDSEGCECGRVVGGSDCLPSPCAFGGRASPSDHVDGDCGCLGAGVAVLGSVVESRQRLGSSLRFVGFPLLRRLSALRLSHRHARGWVGERVCV